MMDSNKLKILCLHGYGQNGEYFRQKMGGIRKQWKNFAELEFISAPHLIQHAGENDDPDAGARLAWWFTDMEARTYESKVFNTNCYGFEDSVKLVESTIQEKGPYDGILGFSQGACFLSLLCCLQQKGVLQGTFKFAIFTSGYLSRCTDHQSVYSVGEVEIPTLHVYGETDSVITADMSDALMETCNDKQIIRHPGGHYMPSNSHFREGYLNFLRRRYAEKTECPER
ncbi:hypothetical protein ONE63_002724 [Megalurothrips usitatus]|uniref:Serine hydrolase domain-containing protein n=1 Tax=Megalurothrips usitatus TaxID=439358 RepID=A0AAV7X8X7_9NEOP|nr:hypothetical protein ONE63_002724 [Megalurothrips usitatus]